MGKASCSSPGYSLQLKTFQENYFPTFSPITVRIKQKMGCSSTIKIHYYLKRAAVKKFLYEQYLCVYLHKVYTNINSSRFKSNPRNAIACSE
jgi:hypothetical protein